MNINPFLKQKLLSTLQEKIISRLYKSIPTSTANRKTFSTSEGLQNTDTGVNDFFNLSPASKKVVSNKLNNLEEEIKHSTDRNIQFIKAIITLKTLVDKNPKISTSNLQSLFSNCGDNKCKKLPFQIFLKEDKNISNSSTEDSGVFFTESYNTNSVDFISSNDLNFILHTSDTDRLLSQSAKYVMKAIEYEIENNAVKCSNFWRGTLVEYGVNVLSVLCETNDEFFEMIYKYVSSVLEDIWNNEERGNHETNESKIHILSEFINSEELCIEFMKFISDKLESALTSEKYRFNLAVKTTNMLTFCYKLLDSYKVLTLHNKLKAKDKLKVKDVRTYDVMTLWKHQFADVQNLNERKTVEKDVVRKLIHVLERFLISYSNDCSLLTKQVLQCLSCIKVLDNISDGNILVVDS